MKSKIVFFFFLSIFFPGIISCDKNPGEKHIIPYAPFQTTINMNIGGESNNWSDKPRYFKTSVPDNKPLGYNGHGIIIFTPDNTEFYCFDATCTNCTDLSSHFEQADLETWYATCPKCHTKFLLPYGTPTDDKGIYPLKSYSVTRTSTSLIIKN